MPKQINIWGKTYDIIVSLARYWNRDNLKEI